MRVLIVDNHEVIWSGLRGVVERLAAQHDPATRFTWFGARDIEAVKALSIGPLDLVLLDYHLPGTSGIEAIRAMRELFDAPPIVIVSGDQRPERIRCAIEAGAAGYILKTMPQAEMVAALGLVMAHGIYLPPIALRETAPAAAPASGEPHLTNDVVLDFMTAELSPRQRQVFARALHGKPNKVIARELGIAESTVKVHLAMVFRALGVHNRTEAMYRLLSADAAGAMERL